MRKGAENGMRKDISGEGYGGTERRTGAYCGMDVNVNTKVILEVGDDPLNDIYIEYGNKCFTFFTGRQVIAVQLSTAVVVATRREGCEALLWTGRTKGRDALYDRRTASSTKTKEYV